MSYPVSMVTIALSTPIIYNYPVWHVKNRHTLSVPCWPFKGYQPWLCPLGFHPLLLQTTSPHLHLFFIVLSSLLSSLWLISAFPSACMDAIYVLSGPLPPSLHPAKLMACIYYLIALLHHWMGCRPLWKAMEPHQSPWGSNCFFIYYVIPSSQSFRIFLLPYLSVKWSLLLLHWWWCFYDISIFFMFS